MSYAYSLSHNTADNVDYRDVEIFNIYLQRHAVEYIITEEHTHQKSQKKDHLQIFWVQDTSKSPSHILQSLSSNIGRKLSLPATLLKRHKGDIRFGFGYCLKEVPETGKILHTNLTAERQAECLSFYNANKDNVTVTVNKYAVWCDYLSRFPAVIANYDCCYNGRIHYTDISFEENYRKFIFLNGPDIVPSNGEYLRWKYSYPGLVKYYDAPKARHNYLCYNCNQEWLAHTIHV